MMPSAAMPACPANWYMLAFSRELRAGQILTRPMGDREVVLYRGSKNGAVSAFGAHCAHMGCHLKHGKVIGDALKCSLHNRVIESSGLFINRDGSPHAGLRQTVFPVREQLGCIFVYAGRAATVDLPTPVIAALGGVAVSPMRAKTLPLPWWTFIGNGMDVEHLQAVHDRRLLETPVFSQVRPDAVGVEYRTAPTGSGLGDRVMSWLARDGVHGRITCHGGSMMLVESKVGDNRAFILLSMVPEGNGSTTLRGLVGVPSNGGKLAGWLKARMATWLFESFLNKDVGILDAMRLHAPLSENSMGDSFTRQLFAFLETRPEADFGSPLPVHSRPLELAS